MKSNKLWIMMVSVAAIGLIAGPVSAQSTMSQSVKDEVALRAASEVETVQGDLKGAIERYKTIAQSKDRAIAARALVRMAQCHEKLGNQEARKIYERLVQDYADQKEAVALARARLGNEVKLDERRMSYRQIWTAPDDARLYGAISRDGRFVTYIDAKGDLFLHDFSSNTNRCLTGADRLAEGQLKVAQYARAPSISRNCRRVAYVWVRDDVGRGQLRLLDLDSDGVPRSLLLLDNPEISYAAPADWSPDGRWIAVEIGRSDKTAQIGLVSVADGELRVLKSIDWRGITKLALSPDGEFLAYDLPASDTTEQRDVFVLATDGSREIRAVTGPSDEVVVGWSNDGTHLLFTSDRSGSNGLWSVPFAEGKIAGTPELLKSHMAFSSMGFTDAGNLYAKIAGAGGYGAGDVKVAAIDFATGSQLSPPESVAQTFVGANQFPAWSRDGKYLAYASRRAPQHFVILIRSADTDEVRELVPSPNRLDIRSVVWAPDGRSLIVNGTDARQGWGIFRVDAQTARTSLLVKQEKGQFIPAVVGISADGTKLYYMLRYWSSETSPSSLNVMEGDLTTGMQRELYRPNGYTFVLQSPDSRHLVVSDPTQPETLVVLSVVGGEIQKLRRGKGARGYGWSADSSALYGIMGSGDVWRLPIDGSAPRRADAKLEASNQPIGPFVVHPDGKRLAFETRPQRKPQEVWVLENFLPSVAAHK